MPKEVSDAELDRMIDQSVQDAKKEEKDKGENGKDAAQQPEQQPAKPGESKESKQQKKDKADKKEAKEDKQQKKDKADKKEARLPGMKPVEGFDLWKVLRYPHLAEKSMNMVELENKLVFIVRRNATAVQIKEAIEKGFGVRVLSVNVMITMKGDKKAYVKLSPESSAADIATRLGMI